jgi:antitoxin YefM
MRGLNSLLLGRRYSHERLEGESPRAAAKPGPKPSPIDQAIRKILRGLSVLRASSSSDTGSVDAAEKHCCAAYETIRSQALTSSPSTIKLYSMIKTLSYSRLRAKLAMVLDQAGETLEPIIVERRGKPAIALIDANELSSMMELIHLLRSPANAKRLIEAIEEVKSGSGTEMTLEQFLERKWQTGAKV